MLLEFSVENFLSFYEKAMLNTRTVKKDALNSFTKVGNETYNNVIAIYGANASGKTSFLRAITFVMEFLFNSRYITKDVIIEVNKFALKTNNSKPSSFELLFDDRGVKYRYSFSCDQFKVYEEKLVYYPNNRETLVFERKNVNEYKFGADESMLKKIVPMVSDNKLFLTIAAIFNHKICVDAYNYLIIDCIFRVDKSAEISFAKMYRIFCENNELDDFLKFSTKLLNNCGIDISSIDIEKKDKPELISMTSGRPIFNRPYKRINTHHIVGEEDFALELADESLGTSTLFKYSAALYIVLKNGGVFVIDELDKSLHQYLVRHIVELFADKDINKNNAQIIFTTHDTSLLSTKYLRRDQVWFTEKDQKTLETCIYPLSEFSTRSSDNLEANYILGRYGAIPFIKYDNSLFEE